MCGSFYIGNDNNNMLVCIGAPPLDTMTSCHDVFNLMCRCVYYRQLGGRGRGRERGERKGEDDKWPLLRVYCFLCSMSHVENMHTKQTKTIVCCSAVEFYSGFRQGSASVCHNNSVWQWSLNSLLGGWSFINTSTLITLKFTPTCT